MTSLRIQGGLLFSSCRIQINEISFDLPNLLIDTGSAGTAFSADFVRAFGISLAPADRIVSMSGIGGIEYVIQKRVDHLSVAEFQVAPFSIQIGRFDQYASIDGILGLDFMRAAKITLDMGRLEMRPT